MPPIAFGTDGWRARIGEDYTYDTVRRCAEGVARFVTENGSEVLSTGIPKHRKEIEAIVGKKTSPQPR